MLVVPARRSLTDRHVESRRLTLRPVDVTDAPDIWKAVDTGRAHLEPWLPWVPFSADAEASARFAEACAGDWDAGRACRFAIRERGWRSRFFGVVGLEQIVHLHECCHLGYWLREDMTGKGYMTEAAKLALGWAFFGLGAHRVQVAAATDNHPSLAVIARLGFRFEGISRQAELCAGRRLDHAVFGMLVTDDVAQALPRPSPIER